MRSISGLPWLSLIAVAVSAPLGAQGDLGLSIAERARAVQPGEVVRLRLTASRALERVDGVNQGRSIGFYPLDEGRTWEALIGIDVTHAPGPHTVAIHASETGQPPRSLVHGLVVRPKVFPSRRISVATRFVEPPPAVRERIRREAERLTAIFSSSSPARLWSQPFARPVRGGATSVFGRRSIVNGQLQDPHRGADFRAPLGTTVRSPNDGTVVLAEELYFAGRTVIVDHGLGLYSLLAHLSVIRARQGDRVRRGDIVGRSGATGRVTGPHLHWAVRLGDASVDPLSLVEVTAD
jgi:murein DD-endopeptidase MepM/ murein hydrolase activator NlpD